MLSRNSPAPKGPRHGSSSLRGRGAGVQKRRAGPGRVDKDGDMMMDAAEDRNKARKGRLGSPAVRASQGAVRGGASRGGTSRGAAGRKAQNILRGLGSEQANVSESRLTSGDMCLKVDGLSSSKAASNSDGGIQSLLGFLERKAGHDPNVVKSMIKKSHMVGSSVIITASATDIAAISKLDGYSFAGSPLSIQPYENDSRSNARSERNTNKKELVQDVKDTKEKFKAILATRYDGTLKLLNLSALAQDPGLTEMGLGSFDGKVTSKLFPALMVVCDQLFETWQEKRDAIVSVSLANNGLENVSHVTALAQTFPDLKNLDLSGNSLENTGALSSWRWKFRHLENLVLTNNPIETKEPNFNIELMKWYPKLQFLNSIQVRTPEQVSIATEAANSAIPISGPDFRDVGQVGEHFIRQFTNLYDNDRASLLANFYDARSVFSMSINMSAPRDREHSSAIPPWSSYTKHSRNLKKITHAAARMNRRYTGSQAIQTTWADFPPTRHPDLVAHTDKYIIECHPLPGLADPNGQSPFGVDGLIITMHGEFEEQSQSATDKAMRSFSRTFVLGPGGPGGPPIRVVSDMLTLRAHAPLATPSQHATGAAQAIVAPPAVATLPLAATPEQQQQAITKQLMERTNMTSEYAIMCLTETGWDLEKAYGAFEANKTKLPANAFVGGIPR